PLPNLHSFPTRRSSDLDDPATFYSPLLQAQSVDLAVVDPYLKTFSGGFTDGRYAYFVPYNNGAGTNYGKVARLDLQNFITGGVTDRKSTRLNSSHRTIS